MGDVDNHVRGLETCISFDLILLGCWINRSVLVAVMKFFLQRSPLWNLFCLVMFEVTSKSWILFFCLVFFLVEVLIWIFLLSSLLVFQNL